MPSRGSKQWREERQYPSETQSSPSSQSGEYRTAFQKDRDRILYSASFRRLAEITQVASPLRGYAIHNRLTHVLKVAQVARRLAEALRKKTSAADLRPGYGLDPDVVETAALAHDLGHPPFGHLAEEEIHKSLTERGLTDGFEGNAQTFRIVTKLESRGFVKRDGFEPGQTPVVAPAPTASATPAPTTGARPAMATGAPVPTLAGVAPKIQPPPDPFPGGLNLTRASLNAIMKYPWRRQRVGKASRKWNVYDTEMAVFEFARDGLDAADGPTLEAQVMDWSDDLAYGVHDFEDFYRSGVIPVAELIRSQDVRDKFYDASFVRLGITNADKQSQFIKVAEQLLGKEFPFNGPYEGTPANRVALKSFSNSLIKKFMLETRVKLGQLKRPPDLELQIEILKQLTWHYVIEGPDLALEQIGQREIIRCVLKTFIEHAQKNDLSIFTPRYKLSLQLLHQQRRKLDVITQKKEIAAVNDEILRIAGDIVAHLSEREIFDIHSKLKG